MGVVTVEYDDFSKDKTSVQKISFELIENTMLVLTENKTDNTVVISMIDTETDDTELNGELDIETLNNLIRSLNIFKNQLPVNPPQPSQPTD